MGTESRLNGNQNSVTGQATNSLLAVYTRATIYDHLASLLSRPNNGGIQVDSVD